MALNRRSMSSGDAEKHGQLETFEQAPAGQQKNIVDPDEHLADMHHDLERGLKARHITMIAIGGAIGTGLIIGT